ncbi:toxin YdaT family protein [Serratia fonticola]|uniref:toxin YdaT family protein n=1 Tax=Serratia fonticola TaxID=47917 RepID=UPI0034C69EFA
MEITDIAAELEEWARAATWGPVTEAITQEYSGDLLAPLAGIECAEEYSRQLHNNQQTIQRAFRGDSDRYRARAKDLTVAVLLALPAERRLKLLAPRSAAYLASIANQECIEATSALVMGESLPVLKKEVLEGIRALAALLPPGVIHIQLKEGITC